MDIKPQGTRILELSFPGLRQFTAIGTPPNADSFLTKSVMRMLDEIDVLDSAITRAEGTGDLTRAGMIKHVADLRAHAEKLVQERGADYAEREGFLAAKRAKLFEVPKLDAGDAAGAARDSEIRTRFAAMPQGHQRDALRAAMVGGQHEDLLRALLRDPFPSPDGEMAKGIWNLRIEQQQQAVLSQLDAEDAETEWAQSVVGAATSVLNKSAPFVDRPLRPTPDYTYSNEEA